MSLFIEVNKQIKKHYRFCASKSYLTILLIFLSDVHVNWDVRLPYDIICLDFKKRYSLTFPTTGKSRNCEQME